jgi:hypothetical protein
MTRSSSNLSHLVYIVRRDHLGRLIFVRVRPAFSRLTLVETYASAQLPLPLQGSATGLRFYTLIGRDSHPLDE